jgi:hypothetical protein
VPTCQAWIISWSSVSFTSVLDRNLRSGSESATRQRLPRPAYEHCAEKQRRVQLVRGEGRGVSD